MSILFAFAVGTFIGISFVGAFIGIVFRDRQLTSISSLAALVMCVILLVQVAL